MESVHRRTFMRLHRTDQVIIIISVLMFIVYSLMAIFVIEQEHRHIDHFYNSNLLNISYIVASDPIVVDKLQQEDFTLDEYANSYLIDVSELSLIEILDMSGLRYSHPNPEFVGEYYEHDDYMEALAGQVYLRTNVSSLGESRKAFVPIFDGNTQIGVAVVEVLMSDINADKQQKTLMLSSTFAVGYILSVVGLVWLSKRFISELFGFQPDEMALLYSENKSVIEQLNEALISIDKEYRITTINTKLKQMFDIDESILGRSVKDVFPYVDFEPIMEQQLQIEHKYKKIYDQKLLMNAFPLYLDDEIIGATAIFRSHLEVDALVDQIKGYQQIAEALRSQKHEFQNKLHVVLGLIKMKDYKQAENYIMEHVYSTNLASDYYSSRLKDDKLLALFVGKEIQSKEFNAQLLLTSDSYLEKKHPPINSDDLVLVIGNLIDNSLEAYVGSDVEDKRIVVDVFEDEEMIKLTVIDQAGGICPTVIDHIFERGVSTKNGQSRGTGLSLVNEIVTLYHGEKTITSTKEETKIEIILMKVIG